MPFCRLCTRGAAVGPSALLTRCSERKGGAKGSLEKLSNDLTGAGQPGMEDPFVQAMMQISKNNNAVLAKA